ncbi:MAG: UDP-2,3-diacylglucosamine diphosphatase [Schlesneria sp.]
MPAQYPRGATRRSFRTLFVSDVHLGCRYAQAEKFLAFLEQVQPEQIYIVGDFIDGWRLSRRWHWQQVYVRILQRLVQLASQGTQVYYAPGNHDEFLRDYLHDFGLVTVADQFIHRTADGRRFVVLHGDQFDDVERGAKWLSIVGAFAYDRLVSANGMINQVRRCFKLKDWRFSTHVKVWAKQAVQFISDFEERLVCHAKELECDGVICGHIHVPRIENLGDITYCNTGDWVEHCTAVVEHESGELELVDWSHDSTELPVRVRERSLEMAALCDVTPAVEHVAASVHVSADQRMNSHKSLVPANLAGLLR